MTRNSGLVRCLQLIALAAAYFVAARLSLLLAIPPGYASPVWPPAGIALAGLLLYGPRLWPAVFLASCLVNLKWGAFDAASLLRAGAMGVGAASQSLLGVWLVRRFVGFPSALAKGKEVIRFFVVTGPVACLVGASVGTLAMRATGAITFAEAATNWLTWWSGDVLGVTVVVPIALALLGQPRAIWAPRIRTVALPVAVFLPLIIAFSWRTQVLESARQEQQFQRRSAEIRSAISLEFERQLEALKGLGDLFGVENVVDARSFARFAAEALHRHPGVFALEWIPRVSAAERPSVEESLRLEGFTVARISEAGEDGSFVPASPRDVYYPIRFVEPLNRLPLVPGFDLGSEKRRLAALEQARDTGETVATEQLRLMSLPNQVGFLVYDPVYSVVDPKTVEERRQTLRGFTLAVFISNNLLSAASRVEGREGLWVRWEDDSAPADRRVVFADSGAPPRAYGFYTRLPMSLAGREWALSVWSAPQRPRAEQSLQSVIGFLFVGLFGSFLLLVSGESTRTEEAVVDAAPDAMVIVDKSGTIVVLNKETERLFGYARSELLGGPITRLIPDASIGRHALAVGSGQPLSGVRKNGEGFPVEIRVSRLQGRQGELYAGAIRDISERQKAEVDRSLLAAVVDSSDDAIITLTTDEVITSWNRGAERLYGFTGAEAVGQPISRILPDFSQDESRGLNRGHFETRRRRKDGQIIYTSLTVSTIKDAQGNTVGLSKIARDISERRRLESVREKLALESAARVAAEEASRMKSGFMWLISHEIRTPLAALHVNAKILLAAGNSGNKERAAAAVQRASTRLAQLVEGVLEYTRLESGTLNPRFEDLDVGQLVAEVVNELKWQADERKLSLSSQGETDLAPLRTDGRILRVIVHNLVHNAIKYTDQGGVQVLLSRSPERFFIAVKDSGTGIAQEDRLRIFSPFVQLEDIEHKHRPGVGLGLALVKRLAEALGGVVELESEVGRGSTFTLVLPSTAAEQLTQRADYAAGVQGKTS